MNNPVISVVIPCYNEEESIPRIYQSLCGVFAELEQNHFAGEFIFIDDGSKDGTQDVLETLSAKDPRVHFMVFSRNFGKEAALLAGLQKAYGEYAATLDADGQDPPELIPKMLEAIISGAFDCAGTRRVTRMGEPPVRSFFARQFYKLMAGLADTEVVDGARDFRVMNRAYVNAVLSLPERGRFSKGIFPWLGFRTKWFEYNNIERKAGVTKWSFWKLFLYSLDGIIAFSTKPLAVASILGVLLFLLSLGFTGFIAARRVLFGDPVAGWASTVCIILFCSGLQLFSTGILGGYLSKVYAEVKQRPHYIVRYEK